MHSYSFNSKTHTFRFIRSASLVFVAGLIFAPASAPGTYAEGQPAAKPNILVIVADDLGYGDVGFQGGKEIPTPNIDGIAASGVRFTNGYVSGPVCSPTRAGLVTGRYQQRFGHEFNPGGTQQTDNSEVALPLSERTIADALKAAGYRTAIVGKWHLGSNEKFRPQQRGFDEFYGFLGGAHPYVPSGKGAQGGGPIFRNNEQIEAPKHLTEAFGEEASAFIKRQKDQPFFLYLTFNAVHNPLQPDDEHLAKFSSISDPKRRAYAALLSGLDDNVGKVLNTLRSTGKEDNTLVFFVSDNGGPQLGNSSNNHPLTGDKGTVREGGIRVPYVLQWKSKLPAGKTFDSPVISLDIAATAAAAAGAKLGDEKHPIDGVDLVPFVLGQSQSSPHKALYWRFGVQNAIRQGDYKLRQQGDQAPQLFNLASDIVESHDVASEHPEIVNALKTSYAEWNEQLVEPLWKTGKSSGKNNDRATRREARRKAADAGQPARTKSS